MRLLIDMESQMEDFQLRFWATRSNRFLHFLVPAEEVQENETQEWLGRLKETEKKARLMPVPCLVHHMSWLWLADAIVVVLITEGCSSASPQVEDARDGILFQHSRPRFSF